jgi:hypothetical protein
MGLVPQLEKAAKAENPTVANISGDNRLTTLNPRAQAKAYEAIVSRLQRVPDMDEGDRPSEASWQ